MTTPQVPTTGPYRPYACTHCEQPVVRAANGKGDIIPVTLRDEPSGNLALGLSLNGLSLVVTQLTRGRRDAMRRAGQPTYFHHALTCTYAREWHRGALPSRGFSKR